MFVALLYFLFFFFLFLNHHKKNGATVGSLLLFFYLLSASITLFEFFVGPINHPTLETDATIYFLVCVFVSLWPFLVLAKYDCRQFVFSDTLIYYISFFLIVFGFVEVFKSLFEIYSNSAIFLAQLADIRTNFYNNLSDQNVIDRSVLDKITIFMHYSQFLSPFCSIYMLSKGRNVFAVLLAIASLGFPMHNMTFGEREAILVFFSNWLFCFTFFRPVLSKSAKQKIKRVALWFSIPFMIFFIAMTLARFSTAQGGGFESLLLYGGDMPYYFSHIFDDPNMEAQALGGRICFDYLFPVNQRIRGGFNEYINSDIYLNQFGGVAGSFYLDFGRYAIGVIAAFACLYYLVIKSSHKLKGKYPFHIFILFYFSYQILFMNIFYFDFSGLYKLFIPAIVFIVAKIYPKYSTNNTIRIYGE